MDAQITTMDDRYRREAEPSGIHSIPLSQIDDFPDHPFKVKLDEDMDQLVQSITDRGIITPVVIIGLIQQDTRCYNQYRLSDT